MNEYYLKIFCFSLLSIKCGVVGVGIPNEIEVNIIRTIKSHFNTGRLKILYLS